MPVETLPLLPGYWRQSAGAAYVRPCPVKGNTSCAGGANASELCTTGHRGPFCSLCEDGYYGGRGVGCQRCDVELASLTIGAVIGGACGAILLCMLILLRVRRTSAARVIGRELMSALEGTDDDGSGGLTGIGARKG